MSDLPLIVIALVLLVTSPLWLGAMFQIALAVVGAILLAGDRSDA